MTSAEARDRGRAAFHARRWAEAFARLQAADRDRPLPPEDLERLAVAAYLTGRAGESTDLLTRAHQACLEQGDRVRAARWAFWIGFTLQDRAEAAQASGWFARARRILDETPVDCVERGYLQLPIALSLAATGNLERAHATFAEAASVGDRFHDPDLASLARQGCGRALIRRGDVAGGVALLDEVMAAVTAGALSPIIAGTVYCSVLDACFEIFDLRRAREWTEALARWCASQEQLVPYRGVCLVHRAEILQLHGAWSDALDEARRACERLADPPGQNALGPALYQAAELHRLRGELSDAERLYREASERGRGAQPGLALLRLAQGQVGAAAASIRSAMDEARDRKSRSRLLAACVEISIAAADVAGARAAADELSAIAAALDAPFLRAMSAHAAGAVRLAGGDARGALARLRDACSAWQGMDAPYEAARTRLLMGIACRQLGDVDTGDLELEAARRMFVRLGAGPDLARLEMLSQRRETTPAAAASAGTGLSDREVQVLRLIATGRTNRVIAGDLGISEKTVARHVSNIFTKLDLSTRAAATAYAYDHGLVSRPPA